MNVFLNFDPYTILETTGKTNQYQRKTKFQLKLVKSKKNANSRSHLRKINEKQRQISQDATHLHSLSDSVTRENHHCSRTHLRTKSMIKYTKRNIAIASAATFAQNDMIHKNLQTFAPIVTCSQNSQQNALKEPKTIDLAVTCAQLQK